MKPRVFYGLLIALAAIGIMLTVAHLLYIINAYEHCSIITFIAEELS